MLKNNKGITLTALVITIIILGIIATIVIRTSSPVIQEAKIEDVKTTLLLIQAKWKVEKEKAKFDPTTSMFPDQVVQQSNIDDGTHLAEEKGQLVSSYKVTTVDEKWNVDTSITYYKLSQECLNAMGLEDADASKGYIVNYSNNDIILESGFKYDETTYYKLSDLENLGD